MGFTDFVSKAKDAVGDFVGDAGDALGLDTKKAVLCVLNPNLKNDFSQVNGTGYAPQMNGTGYAPQMNATGYAPAQNGFAQAAAPAQPAGFAQQQNAAPAQNAQSNMGQMHYMPGQFVHEDGKSYSHVERLAQPLSASSCFRLIEFMRNGESIIVNTELIQDERENAHCLDLLYGAAFTMGYTFTKISRLRIYLISPANICAAIPVSYKK